MFDSARQALRSALALQAGGAGLPLGIGVGLDAGEAIPVGEGYRGGALNLAARLCSLAGPGEVLASETVLQLARAVDGVKYGERRVERVKGFAQPVTAVEILPADRRTKRWTVRRLKRVARRAARRRPVQLAVALAVTGAIAVAAVLGLAGSAGAAADRSEVAGRRQSRPDTSRRRPRSGAPASCISAWDPSGSGATPTRSSSGSTHVRTSRSAHSCPSRTAWPG